MFEKELVEFFVVVLGVLVGAAIYALALYDSAHGWGMRETMRLVTFISLFMALGSLSLALRDIVDAFPS